MAIKFKRGDKEVYKADMLDEYLVERKRYAFFIRPGCVIEAQYDQMTVDEDGFIIFVDDVVAPETDYDGEPRLIIGVKDILSVEEV